MNVTDALNWRYAVKQFSDQKISTEQLKALLNATRLSASSYGLQPYRVIVVESEALKQQLLSFSYGQDKVVHCSHLIVFAAQTDIGDAMVNDYITRHAQITNQAETELRRFSDHMKSALAAKTEQQKLAWAHHQVHIALGNLLTSAAMMQIDTCPMGGIEQGGYDNVLGLQKKSLTTTVVCPIGYRHRDDALAHAPKVRLDYDDFVLEV